MDNMNSKTEEIKLEIKTEMKEMSSEIKEVKC